MEVRKLFAFFVVLVALFFFLIHFEFSTKFVLRLSPSWYSKIHYGLGNAAVTENNLIARSIEIANNASKTRRKVILVYTTLFGAREWYHLPAKEASDFTAKRGCKVHNCEITYDNNRLKESDAVIFHARDMPSPDSLRDISRRMRPLHQRWVYFISENPLNTPNPSALNGLFNWTMTYKKESDIWIPYKRYAKIDSTDPVPKVIDYAAEKNKVPSRKLVLWVVSNCGHAREILVKKLQDLISIDVGGGCGGRFKSNVANCSSQGREGCMQKIKDYKFYLSFENAFCDQYVTEKYWYNALEHDAVPIVLGGGPYNDPKVAIPGSFINVQDFKTVKDLANYLIYLDKNDTAYNEYFAWKQTFKLPVHLGWPYPGIWGCEICEKLHFDSKQRVYDKLSDFWSYEDCKNRDIALNEMLKNS